MNYHQPEETSFNSQYGEEYAITLQFQLQREKQKNKILEQRLRNKEMFIVEMKKMQSQMELLSEKWRQQLLDERQKRQLLENVTLREYSETIAELEHKINLLQGNVPQKKIKADERIQKNRSTERLRRQSEQLKYRQQAVKQKQQVNELLKNFANRFVEMFKIYNRVEEESLKRKLKAGWKWIKEVVKQWQQYQNSLKQIFKYAQSCLDNGEKCDPSRILNQDESEQSEEYDQNDV